MLRVLTISSDRNLFKKNSAVRRRAIQYSALSDEYYAIVFSTADLGLKLQKIARNAWIIPTNSKNRWHYVFDALKIGKKMSGIDVASSQDPFESGWVAWKLSKFFKSALQIQIHTDFGSSHFRSNLLNRLRLLIARIVLPKADIIRVVSIRAKKALKKYKIKARVVVLPIFVDINQIRNENPNFDLHKKFKNFNRIILMVSRLQKEKDVGLAIDVFKAVSEAKADVALVIVGDGSERKNLEAKVRNFGLEKKVFFEGWQSDILSYYKTADVYLSTSLYEGYGLSLVEALASGLPVVTTDVGIAGDYVLGNINALVCSPGDSECIERALKRILSDDKLREKLRAGATTISDKFFPRGEYDYLEKYRQAWIK
ncbi:hypothetical protein COV42_02940 [Candidatus Campbellbacteria bacterium CG11_big_fil_rev_8_21_14_0_20_44_21]|uniref:Glycosyl transferase family 1 domain-containing protein n=1 Tax=Candidatus Campbellbacteria bacterium CG22_combo_CG10-13_8_21_14_all_43_18 TaxID=1974530 RepID=A0A2H0DW79_9BACT|nr:MAG: hypothetical protein COW82_02105 [Candidatus Campbellbacteria bacterium CG22_combo_CG10-13_8_21_14_all_43_18]PIR24005.1 MAG: hypothetical protein COV42_02940 [Candidatus Campbellbacteria bacterium CG11_big_fil_rev_8_21_14_0_20_44_21]